MSLTASTGIPYYKAIDFDWDEAKAESNYIKHGISFELAKDVFKDAFALEFPDDREAYGEERFVLIGMAENPSSLRDLYRTTRCDASDIRPEGDEK